QVKRSQVHKRSAQTRPQQLKKITVPGLVLIGIVILMIGAFVIPNIVPAGSRDSPQTIESEEQINPASELSVETTDDVVPGFDNSPRWETKIPQDASVTASDRRLQLLHRRQQPVPPIRHGQDSILGKDQRSPHVRRRHDHRRQARAAVAGR
ncbi:MAG: hypothetical protein L0G36_07915, partial [Brevibacterium sp.]|nr:hypothetical protein [Brevibacterium sp.]